MKQPRTLGSSEDTSVKANLKDYFVVSADSHVNEPNDLWATRSTR
jgi:hypothetical protein